MFFQFKTQCLAHMYQAVREKNKSRGKSSFSFLKSVLDLHARSKVLIKKIMNNIIIQECFEALMLELGVFTSEELAQIPYLADLILVNLLDQVWIVIFLNPILHDLVESLLFEIHISHTRERINDIYFKKPVFRRVMRLLEKTQDNQVIKDTFNQIIRPGQKPSSHEVISNYCIHIEHEVTSAITKLMTQIHDETSSFFEYCKEQQRYQRTNFVEGKYLQSYQQIKREHL